MNGGVEKLESNGQDIGAGLRQGHSPSLQKADWLAFAATVLVSLVIYGFTLIPSVGLENSGVFITGAMYAGVPHPPGYVPWTLWAWVFIKLLPFGNVAWRAGVSSITAGALACGVISIMVSFVGGKILKAFSPRLNTNEEKWLRGISGFAAGIIFGSNSPFWSQTVTITPWPLSILLLCLVLYLLMRWIYEPKRRYFLYISAFCYGLLLVNSQIHLALLPAIPFLVTLGNEKVGRDIFLSGFVLFLFWRMMGFFEFLYPIIGLVAGYYYILMFLGVLAGLCGIALAIRNRRLFSEIKTLIICFACFLSGLSLYFYSAIASMTDPPMNWSYPRTIEGFFHLISRGQYEERYPTESLKILVEQAVSFFKITGPYFGWPYVPIVILPFLFFYRFGKPERKWILGLLAPFTFLAFLMIDVLNPNRNMASDNGPWSWQAYLSSSYVIMAVWFGYGLILLGILLTKRPLSRHPS